MARVQRGARSGGTDDAAIRVDTRDLYALTKALQNVDKKLATRMKAEMRKVAEPLRRAVADEASWSKRIPKATKASTRFTAKTSQVLITVNRKQAPHARPLENDGREGTFEHPVFAARSRAGRARQVVTGKRTVKQPARPFFEKAIKRTDHRTDEAFQRIADGFAADIGFK